MALFGGCIQIYFCGRRGGHYNVEVGCVNIVERPYSGGGRRLQGVSFYSEAVWGAVKTCTKVCVGNNKSKL